VSPLRVDDVIAARTAPHTLALRFDDVPVRVFTDDPGVQAGLARYYAPWLVGDVAPDTPAVTLLQGEVASGDGFVDAVRGDGKRVKEAVREIDGGRLVLKRQTGVVMGIWPGRAVAAGDVRRHLNQAVNLVNHLYAAHLMARGYRLFHAAAVVRDTGAVVLAGVPGAGKSTASLHFVEAGWRFLSNDRVLARATADGAVEVRGYPKQPRVNPGTLVHHRRLATTLEAEDRRALLAMAPAELWALERKSDVDLDALYGAGTMLLTSRMTLLVVLRWRPACAEPAIFRRLVEPELLDAVPLVAKDLGAFGVGPAATQRASDAAAYVDLMRRVPVHEVRGGMDLRALEQVVSVAHTQVLSA
jgi:HprK-related kinase B